MPEACVELHYKPNAPHYFAAVVSSQTNAFNTKKKEDEEIKHKQK